MRTFERAAGQTHCARRTSKRYQTSVFASLALAACFAAGCAQEPQTDRESATDDAEAATPETQSSGVADDGAAAQVDGAIPGGSESGESTAERTALAKADPRGSYGAGILLDERVSLQRILEQPDRYEGRIVQVRGTVTEVCPRRGCWIDLADDSASLRVKVTDGDIVFPLSAKGREAVVEGIVEKIELDEEQHRGWKAHEAEERGEAFDPTSVAGPYTMWRIQGLGARIGG